MSGPTGISLARPNSNINNEVQSECRIASSLLRSSHISDILTELLHQAVQGRLYLFYAVFRISLDLLNTCTIVQVLVTTLFQIYSLLCAKAQADQPLKRSKYSASISVHGIGKLIQSLGLRFPEQ